MTLQNLVEGIEQVFPSIGRTQILKEFDLAQKTLASEAELLEESGSLSDVSSYISWNLPSGFVKLNEVDFYDTSGNPLYKENLSIDFEVYDGQIHFVSTTTTPLESMPSTIIYIILRYEKLPSDIETVDSTVTIDEVEYPAMEAFVMKRFYSRVKVPKYVDKNGEVVSVIDNTSLNYWNGEYHRLKVEAKRRKNLLDTTERKAVYYPTAGQTYFLKRTKEASIDTIEIPSYETLFSKYVRFKAVSPGTFTEILKVGFGDLSYAMDGNDIVVTSTAEFTTSMWADDIQNGGFEYISTSEFRFTPEPLGAWGTSVFELWIH